MVKWLRLLTINHHISHSCAFDIILDHTCEACQVFLLVDEYSLCLPAILAQLKMSIIILKGSGTQCKKKRKEEKIKKKVFSKLEFDRLSEFLNNEMVKQETFTSYHSGVSWTSNAASRNI